MLLLALIGIPLGLLAIIAIRLWLNYMISYRYQTDIIQMEDKRDIEKCKKKRKRGKKKKKSEKTIAAAKRKHLIWQHITAKLECLLVIWKPGHLMRPDCIATALSQLQKTVRFKCIWKRPTILSNIKTLYAVVAEFAYEDDAVYAAKELMSFANDWMILPMDRFIDFVVDAEISENNVGKERIRLLILGKQFIESREDRKLMHHILNLFGSIKSLRFYATEENLEHDIIVEVTYAYAANAYAASMYLDGLFFRNRHANKIEVEMDNSYSASIYRKLKRKLTDLEDESKRVHL